MVVLLEGPECTFLWLQLLDNNLVIASTAFGREILSTHPAHSPGGSTSRLTHETGRRTASIGAMSERYGWFHQVIT